MPEALHPRVSISKTLASHNLEVEEVVHLVGRASHLGVGEGLLHPKAQGKVGTVRDMSGENVEQGAHQAGGEISKHRVLHQLEGVAGETVRRRKEQAHGKNLDGGDRKSVV